MTTYVSGLYNINGVISTDKSVMQNLNALCTSAGSWMTYDISDGKWSVVINRAGSSVASFNDTNIIGGINVSSTGINDLYNSVTLEFPHKDLRDQTDYIDFDIPAGDRFPNELDNRLNMSIDLVNDPIQAAYIASAELKQSRVDKIIEFRTDFSKLGLKAGDLIDVTNTMYGYSNKMFRITKMQEEDAEGLVISITALEYNSDVYSTDGLTRTLREKKTGITPKAANQSLSDSDNLANANGISFAFQSTISTGAIASAFNAYAGTTPFGGSGVGPDGFSGNQTTVAAVSFSLTRFHRSVTFFCQTPVGAYDFERKVNGSVLLKTGFYAFTPCKYKLFKDGTLLSENTADWQTQTCIFPLYNLAAGTYTISITPLPTYDLDQETNLEIWPRNFQIAPQSSGGGFTVTGLAIR